MGVASCLEHTHKLNPRAVPKNISSTAMYVTDDYAAKVSYLNL
jgi:hypothetical protein